MNKFFHIHKKKKKEKEKLPFGQPCFARDFGEKTSVSLDLAYEDVAKLVAGRVESGVMRRSMGEIEKRYTVRFLDVDATSAHADCIAKDTEKNRQLILEVNQMVEEIGAATKNLEMLIQKMEQLHGEMEWYADEELCAR